MFVSRKSTLSNLGSHLESFMGACVCMCAGICIYFPLSDDILLTILITATNKLGISNLSEWNIFTNHWKMEMWPEYTHWPKERGMGNVGNVLQVAEVHSKQGLNSWHEIWTNSFAHITEGHYCWASRKSFMWSVPEKRWKGKREKTKAVRREHTVGPGLTHRFPQRVSNKE